MKLVPVTKEHITEGEANNCETCPVALALRGCYQFPLSQDRVEVGRDTSLLKGAIIEHSDEVRRWIGDFDEWGDRGDDVAPLPAPAPVTLVLEPGWLLTLAEWQQEQRP